jgi:hypothetical protein
MISDVKGTCIPKLLNMLGTQKQIPLSIRKGGRKLNAVEALKCASRGIAYAE